MQHASGDIVVCKTKGKVINLESCAQGKDLSGSLGIAHTRWAAQESPPDGNAHPHYSESSEIALVHNGIIENYRELKRSLSAEGYTFQSDTDRGARTT